MIIPSKILSSLGNGLNSVNQRSPPENFVEILAEKCLTGATYGTLPATIEEQAGSSGFLSAACTTRVGCRQREAVSLPTRRNKILNSSETSPVLLGKSCSKNPWKFIQCHILMPVRNAQSDLNWFAPLSLCTARICSEEISSVTQRFQCSSDQSPLPGCRFNVITLKETWRVLARQANPVG